MPVKTKVGGMATLQKAIVLDSLGYSEDAKKLYKSLRGHGVACECAWRMPRRDPAGRDMT